MMDDARSWIITDESAKEMLSRTLAQRPFILIPPLHRVPLRVGNVVEIVGPSASAKSEILLQAAVDCILPKEWDGIHFGGLERLVIYFDLDCRFDVLRLSEVLKHRLKVARGFSQQGRPVGSGKREEANTTLASQDDDELFLACMKRFLYIQCFSSYEFLAALKTMHHRIQNERDAQGVGIHFLMIDSINAFYWTDRTSQPLPPVGCSRRNLSFQCIAESVVQEIRKLLKIESVLVLATKATILGFEPTMNEAQRISGKRSSEDMSFSKTSRRGNEIYREFMPSAWQSFVTHRILLQVSVEKFEDMENKNIVFPTFISQWLVPPLKDVDKFTVRDIGIFMIK